MKNIYAFTQAVLDRTKQSGKAFVTAVIDTVNHDGVEHAGYLAFLSLLSFFPFLVFFVSILGSMGKSELGEEFINVVLYQNDIIPATLLNALEPRIKEIVSGPPQGLVTLAIVGAIWTASSAVEGLRTILNRAYRVDTPPAYIFRRLMSIVQFLILTVLIITAMLVLVIAPIAWEWVISILELGDNFSLPEWTGMAHWNWTIIRYGFTATILFFVVSSTYYILPNIRQNWKVVMPGALLVVIGWIGVGVLLSMYLSSFDQVNVIYGSLGGVIVALIFFYLFSMILIFGAEFNYSFNELHGQRIEQRESVTKKQPTIK